MKTLNYCQDVSNHLYSEFDASSKSDSKNTFNQLSLAVTAHFFSCRLRQLASLQFSTELNVSFGTANKSIKNIWEQLKLANNESNE